MLDPNNYKKTDFCIYQQFIVKLMYLAYKTKLKIVFIVGQLSK